jgi:hypothetical protein
MPTETPSAELEVTVQINDLHADWKRISYLANYFAEYIAYDFPQRERAENLLSTITNEILEAVVHLAPAQTTLRLHCAHLNDTLMLDVKHQVKAELRPDYVLFVETLGDEDGEQAYLQMLTADVKPEAYFNQLGLMILQYDFEVHLSLNIEQEPENPENKVQKSIGQEINHFHTHVEVLDEVFSK